MIKIFLGIKALAGNIGYKLKNSFSSLPKRKTIYLTCLVVFSLFITGITPFLSSAFYKNNIGVSLTEIYDDFTKNEKCAGGVVYRQSLDSKDEIVYNNAELPRELREIYYDNIFLDAYVNQWDSKQSPARVKINGEQTGFSLLLLPKERYVYNKWDDRYSIPLIFPSTIPARSSPNDLFITKEYADQLIIDGISSTYEDLIGKTIEIPYFWNIESTNYTTNIFVVKGILDSNSEQYANYKNVFGNFFVVNEYFSMPMPSVTYFSITSRKTLLLLIETLLNKYNYESIKSNYSSTSSSYSFQTRITFIREFGSNYSIEKILQSTDLYQSRINDVFNSFANVSYIIYSVLFGLTNIAFLALSFFFISKEIAMFEQRYFSIAKIIIGLFGSVTLILAFLAKTLFKYISLFSSISLNNYIGVIIFIIEFLALLLFLCFIKRNKKIKVAQK